MRQIRIRTLSSKKAVETPNKLEKLVYGTIDKLGVPYKKQMPLFNKFVVDAFFPQQSLVLEIFGRYWHELPVNKRKDFSKKKYLEKCGFNVEVIWDDEIKKAGPEPLLRDIFRKYSLV